ncbi:hypothetical protein BOTNAR_1773g00020 [Botryotinia narcissicola]|uniref:Major facilitator superfamily (MFS) profile domain-containing protein n=1 Tax=Botryotinia narcissicola TaxID=278944 RepID=A0A4Z1H312_9HELO|nr:hypothetical protein BOTNAR_1773g00020 [Botryotinia narcissicola]
MSFRCLEVTTRYTLVRTQEDQNKNVTNFSAERGWNLLSTFGIEDTQGVCTGLGNGFLLTPMSTVVASHFRKKLPLVMGIAACGSVAGGLIYPSMVRTLLPRIGFGWTLRAIGFIQLGTLAAALVSAKPKSISKNTAPIIDLMVFKEPAFVLLFVGSFSAFLGAFFPFFFLSSYAREKQGMSYEDSLNLTLILNGIGFAGRLLPSVLVRFFGPLKVFIGMIFASAICMFTWIPIHSTTGLHVWTAFNSMAVGGVQSLSLAVVAVITTDMSKIGARLGIIFAAIGVGALIGSPICGIIIASNYGSYTGAQTFSGGALVLGGSIMIGAREARRREIHNSIWARI